ncbi:hypothetical protein BkAM31D_05350 [Halalkalibacter krulwichiae]|uniref:Uncharacterized protein n=2 Tax=Halalkalibacter krulwichiae TaxID=199441 RepID=A0A1X9M7D4_9BACI|nr:hypothetical protein [Halalkalibacter krulwichiae]ARK29326.1 hypothetical protein BkAM31D_05350 [Halalkalibacter krulwichiae]
MSLDQIIDLIMQNIVFIAVVIGGLISMFGRLSGANQQESQDQRKRRPHSPPLNEQREEQVDWREIFKQEEREPEPQPTQTAKSIEPSLSTVSEEVSSRQQQLQEQYEEMRRKRERSSRQTKEIRNVPKTEVTSDDKLDLGLNRLSNKEAMKAVVWAEVLGSPRAKRPHPTFSKRR